MPRVASTPATNPLPCVRLLATGGTIVGAQVSKTSRGYQAGAFSINDLVAAVPQLTELAPLQFK